MDNTTDVEVLHPRRIAPNSPQVVIAPFVAPARDLYYAHVPQQHQALPDMYERPAPAVVENPTSNVWEQCLLILAFVAAAALGLYIGLT
ncbi:hypothetical protein [Mycolicibacterium fortuitum]|uniref:hypothetical protein n=1 Tax=Mycolicibacterium fortuitum TaxID=1766 RepID=UPI001CE05B92|nr:hypothetical protein [Mycolicibacterium fortuitum]MCA4727209.1 hypothetical protein [Mycolicibacterium fortuitum]